MNRSTFSRNASVLIGAAAVASSIGNVSVKAGPALQTLNNLTNTADFTINNTYGQSFSVDGRVQSSLTPFAAGGANMGTLFTANTATLTTGFDGAAFGGGFIAVDVVRASVAAPGINIPVVLDAGELNTMTLVATGGTQTIGASVSSTIFGPSNVKASSSFTNQLINDLSAF